MLAECKNAATGHPEATGENLSETAFTQESRSAQASFDN